MSKSPKVSVIMSVYNGEKYLRDAIESILNQTFTDFEFIIVNDASTDTSLEIIESYDDERIKVINNEKNIGLTKSLNKALKFARGEYIARQDADDISLPNRFEKQVEYLDSHPEVALLGTSVYLIDENGKIIGKRKALARPSLKDLFKGNQFAHGSVMFRKSVVDKLGGYNELFKYCQDYELWLRVAKYYEVRNLTQPLYKLRLHDESIGVVKREESVLYHLLAVKLARNDLNEEILEIIRNKGIRSLYTHLNKDEKIFFHKALARLYISRENLELALRECKKVFNLNPFDIGNIVAIVCLYLGSSKIIKNLKTIYNVGENLTTTFRNIFTN